MTAWQFTRVPATDDGDSGTVTMSREGFEITVEYDGEENADQAVLMAQAAVRRVTVVEPSLRKARKVLDDSYRMMAGDNAHLRSVPDTLAALAHLVNALDEQLTGLEDRDAGIAPHPYTPGGLDGDCTECGNGPHTRAHLTPPGGGAS